MKKILFSSLVLVLVLAMTIPVMAQTAVTVHGTVLSVDLVGLTFQLKVSETEIYTVVPPAGFDLAELLVGSQVQVAGLLTDTTLAATDVTMLEVKEYVGTVTAIDLLAGTFTFQTKDGEIFTVTPPVGFDLTTLGIGDVIILNGLQGLEFIIATGIDTLFDGDGEGVKPGNYCNNLDKLHPVASKLAEKYGLYYEQVMSWFCVDGFGFGEIKNAIKANLKLSGIVSVDEILAMKAELGGWGKVKQALGLIGKSKHTQDDLLLQSGQQPGNGHDKNPGPPEHANNDKVKPKK